MQSSKFGEGGSVSNPLQEVPHLGGASTHGAGKRWGQGPSMLSRLSSEGSGGITSSGSDHREPVRHSMGGFERGQIKLWCLHNTTFLVQGANYCGVWLIQWDGSI